MKISYLILVLATFVIMSCNSNKKNETASLTSLDTLLQQYHEDRLKLFPLEATQAGDNRYNDTLLNDLTAEFREKKRAFYSHYKELLENIRLDNLTEKDKLSYKVLMWECNMGLDGLSFKSYLTPINQFESLHLTVGQFAGGTSIQPFKTVEDYDNWLSRLDDFVIWCDTAVVNMKTGMKEGYVLPKALAKKVIPQLADFDHGPAEEHLFYSPIKNFPSDFPAEEKERLTQAYKTMITDKIIPTFKKLGDFFKNEYLPACRESSGISVVPDGEKYYAYMIRNFTTTDKSAKEIFELGKSEVERITQEMETVKNTVGFQGDLKSFFDHLRSRKELMPYDNPEQVIDHFKEIHQTMKPYLEKLFDKVPKTPFEIRRTEAFREASASAEYYPGSVDGTRPGIFFVPIPDVKKYNTLSDEDLFLHEAIPGHHYQISLQQENADLPEFRKTLWYSAYGEGWALYSESLGKELGLYTDPYQYFGMLSAEMHRAIRLVVDAGMHTQGWTREQAIQYSLDHEAETEDGVIAEIERYMSWPGQALSYKIGQLKIRELREKAKNELGDKFSIAEFHNQVLESGCLPLSVLEEKIDSWIMDSKK